MYKLHTSYKYLISVADSKRAQMMTRLAEVIFKTTYKNNNCNNQLGKGEKDHQLTSHLILSILMWAFIPRTGANFAFILLYIFLNNSIFERRGFEFRFGNASWAYVTSLLIFFFFNIHILVLYFYTFYFSNFDALISIISSFLLSISTYLIRDDKISLFLFFFFFSWLIPFLESIWFSFIFFYYILLWD